MSDTVVLAILFFVFQIIIAAIIGTALKIFGDVILTIIGRKLTAELRGSMNEQFFDVTKQLNEVKEDTDHIRNNGVETRRQLNNHGNELIDLRKETSDLRSETRDLRRSTSIRSHKETPPNGNAEAPNRGN